MSVSSLINRFSAPRLRDPLVPQEIPEEQVGARYGRDVVTGHVENSVKNELARKHDVSSLSVHAGHLLAAFQGTGGDLFDQALQIRTFQLRVGEAVAPAMVQHDGRRRR